MTRYRAKVEVFTFRCFMKIVLEMAVFQRFGKTENFPGRAERNADDIYRSERGWPVRSSLDIGKTTFEHLGNTLHVFRQLSVENHINHISTIARTAILKRAERILDELGGQLSDVGKCTRMSLYDTSFSKKIFYASSSPPTCFRRSSFSTADNYNRIRAKHGMASFFVLEFTTTSAEPLPYFCLPEITPYRSVGISRRRKTTEL